MSVSVDLYVPREYQEEAIEWMIERGKGALNVDMGLGKTLIVLWYLQRMLYQPAESRTNQPTLVLCPKEVRRTWLKEVEQTPQLQIHQIAGTKAKRHHALELLPAMGERDIVLTNYESYYQDAAIYNAHRWGVIVFDESTKIKSHASKLFNKVKRLKSQRIFCLSGDMMPNGEMNLWSQYYVLGKLLGDYITHYRRRYFYQEPWDKFSWHLQPGAWDKIRDIINEHTLVIKKTDRAKDIPENSFSVRYVEMEPQERRIYRSFLEEKVALLGDDYVIAQHRLTELMKCRQMCAGWVRLEDDWKRIGSSKERALKELLSDQLAHKNVIVMGQFKVELAAYHSMALELGRTSGILNSDTKPADKDYWITEFMEGRLQTLVCHERTMSHGLNFQAHCSDMVWATLSYDLETFEQACNRIPRIGQTEPCTQHILLSEGSIEEAIWESLQGKSKLTVDRIRSLI